MQHQGVQHMGAKPAGGTAAQPHAPPASSMSGWTESSARDVARACQRTLAAIPAAGPLIFVFFCLAVFYGRRKAKKSLQPQKTGSLLKRSVSMAALHGGKAVIERLVDAHEVGNQTALEDYTADMQRLLNQKPMSFTKLSKAAAKLEMSGNEDEAINILQKAVENAEKNGKRHEAYELQMLVVEMLIYKGDYQKALNCKCLRDREISDARIPLYKAIIYIITDKKDEAKNCYRWFQDIQRILHTPETQKEDSQLFLAMHDYGKFEKLVENLGKDIADAHKSRQ